MTKNEVLREFLLLLGDVPECGLSYDCWHAAFADISSQFKTDGEFEDYMKELWALE